MKKIVITLCIALLCTACIRDPHKKQEPKDLSPTYVRVETGYTYVLLYDKDTKVMYHLSSGSYNYGNLTLLVNPDGTPKLYKEPAETDCDI